MIPSIQWKACCCLSRGCEERFYLRCCCWQLVWNQSSDTFWQLPAPSTYWTSAADTFIPKAIQHRHPRVLTSSAQCHYLLTWFRSLVYLFCTHTPLFYVCELMPNKKYTDFSGRSFSRPVWWIIFTMLCLLYQPKAWLHTHIYLKWLETISAPGPITLLIWSFQS